MAEGGCCRWTTPCNATCATRSEPCSTSTCRRRTTRPPEPPPSPAAPPDESRSEGAAPPDRDGGPLAVRAFVVGGEPADVAEPGVDRDRPDTRGTQIGRA